MLSSSSLPHSLLFIVSLILGHANAEQQPNSLPPSESETLFTIMESMSSDHQWRLSYPNPCAPGSSWPGIECRTGPDRVLHVSRLDFGSPPNPSCKSSASFPRLIFSLPHLQSVFFFGCFTRSRATIVSPSNKLFFNSSLQQLSLRSNPSLTGSIPPWISSLTSLKTLTLSQNRLTGNIPSAIFTLENLIHLDLSYNMLTGIIPLQLGNLKNLEGLDLSYNSLVGSIPRTISELGLLQKLDLSSNSLFGAIPDGIEKLRSLSFMALSNNKLRGPFPKGISRLQNLQYFIMDDNPMFVPLPAELGFLAGLQELRLSNSDYSGKIPESYTKLTNLSSLSLSGNKLTGEIPSGFGSLPHIFHLNLSRNMLIGVVPFDSSFLRRLGKNLDLSGNPGLCLNPADEFSVVKTGVDVCGRNSSGRGGGDGSLIHPLKKSKAPPNHYGACFHHALSIQLALFLGLNHRLLL
ncbi:PREDICTED: protein TOO MANY MOUTHS-like isoform X2 [Tarenaya hassleriana]|uniref:protein TOO MANY MOUTHS-like isoform X1 n=1 Tax=Tarenaya hassleriana TaxID=28532 RepID=UPI00053C65B0|nr:PREDICTED: protein TOO MANY MOUTHS-like isoform X1 [Tarenaya hassleriana]XP_010554700.1 PREDICTED: protein TOO MANY MOUTHS-like isoform X2 [Tarenaya hassleriana]